MESYAISRVGYGKRVNEDFFGACLSADRNVRFSILADGMGGHAAGNVAGRMAVNGFKEAAEKYTYKGIYELTKFLRDTTVEVSRMIERVATENPAYNGMGSTIVILAVVENENKAALCNVGDSRAYCFRSGILSQITKDHSIAQLMLDKGYTREEIKRYLAQNTITKAMGFISGVGPGGLPDTYVTEALRGDIFMLCSDGLSSAVSDFELSEIFHRNATKTSKTLCKEFVRCALGYGSEDDITTLLVRV